MIGLKLALTGVVMVITSFAVALFVDEDSPAIVNNTMVLGVFSGAAVLVVGALIMIWQLP